MSAVSDAGGALMGVVSHGSLWTTLGGSTVVGPAEARQPELYLSSPAFCVTLGHVFDLFGTQVPHLLIGILLVPAS